MAAHIHGWEFEKWKTETLAAGENTVYWKGKAIKIYGDTRNMFMSISEALLFLDDIMDAETGDKDVR